MAWSAVGTCRGFSRAPGRVSLGADRLPEAPDGALAEIAAARIEALADVLAEGAGDSRKFAEHLRAYPDVYGGSASEVIIRFDGRACDDERAAARWLDLAERLREYGMPPRVCGDNDRGDND